MDIKKFKERQENFKFDIQYFKSGTARIFIGNQKTKYYATGSGYDKESFLISLMINDLVGKKLLEGATGFTHLQKQAERNNIILQRLYSGKSFNVYEINFLDNKGE